MATRKKLTRGKSAGKTVRGPRTRPAGQLSQRRYAAIAAALEEMIGGDLQRQLPISPAQDHLDAICYSVNILVGELSFTTASLRQAQAQAEAASEAKSSFLRNASHELRTPLAVIVWLAEVIKDPSRMSHDQLAKAVAGIRRSAQDLLRTTEAVLDLSRLEQPNLEPAWEATDLGATIHEAMENAQPLAEQKQLALRLIIEPDVPLVVMTNAQYVRQVLMNLVANAIKFTSRGEIEVRVQCRDAQVMIDVKDPGVGVPAKARARIFEPFFQVDPSVSQRLGGTGLGLALAKRLAERLAGTLSLRDSAMGEGSTFRFSIPIALAPAPGAISSPRAPSGARPLAGLRILVADDEELVREALAALLETAGASVARAANGHEAVEKALAEDFALIFMDVRMPVLDGLTATARLQAAGIRRPIVALTAGASVDQRAACLAAGCVDQLPKPIAEAELIATAVACQGRTPGSTGRPKKAPGA